MKFLCAFLLLMLNCLAFAVCEIPENQLPQFKQDARMFLNSKNLKTQRNQVIELYYVQNYHLYKNSTKHPSDIEKIKRNDLELRKLEQQLKNDTQEFFKKYPSIYNKENLNLMASPGILEEEQNSELKKYLPIDDIFDFASYYFKKYNIDAAAPQGHFHSLSFVPQQENVGAPQGHFHSVTLEARERNAAAPAHAGRSAPRKLTASAPAPAHAGRSAPRGLFASYVLLYIEIDNAKKANKEYIDEILKYSKFKNRFFKKAEEKFIDFFRLCQDFKHFIKSLFSKAENSDEPSRSTVSALQDIPPAVAVFAKEHRLEKIPYAYHYPYLGYHVYYFHCEKFRHGIKLVLYKKNKSKIRFATPKEKRRILMIF